MIHPLQPTDEKNPSSLGKLCYVIVPGASELPAFNPLLMLKSVLLSVNSVKQFNRVVVKFKLLVFLSVIVGIGLRFATFAVAAPTGRLIAPIAAILHLPGMAVFEAGMRVDYAKIILRTFDFWFLQAANTLWVITLSAVLNDLRVSLVAVCWINFTNLLFQETYLRNTTFMIVYSMWEWMFNAALMVWLSLGFLDDVHHFDLATANGRTLSTKDLLANAMATGGLFAAFSLFLPKNTHGAGIVAVIGLAASTLFSVGCACCCQRQLLKQVMTSFHFLFLAVQIVAAGVCVMDIFYWRWIPVCGVTSSLLLTYTILTIDALTPIMKRRLRFRYWMPVTGIILFWLAEMLLLVDVLVLGCWDLRDRVFLDLDVNGRRTQFHVAPFLLSRLVTIFVWSGRYAYVVLTRLDDNVLVLLRGEVEFDYEGWKKQASSNTPNK